MHNDHYQQPTGPEVALHGQASLLLAVLLVAGCGATPPSMLSATAAATAPASMSAAAAGAWAFADVANPAIVTDAPSLAPGYQCSPCHPAAANQLFGVATTPTGLLAVGVQQPPAVAIAFASADGAAWVPADGWDPGDRTTAIAAVSNASSTVVVGSSPDGAAAWVRADGRWTAASPGGLDGQPGATAMTAVTAWRGGFLAGGYRDDPGHGSAVAATWRSTDGLAWTRDVAGDAFAGGRIWGVAAHGDTLVAVGSGRDPSYGPAAAWVAADGAWRRATVTDPSGLMRAVTVTADGFVAVGQNGADDGARVWRSVDGTTWTPVADQPALHNHGLPSRMLSVAADDRGLVAGGWRADAANGSSAAWTSIDGEHWDAASWVPAFSGGQIRGVVLAGATALGVGRSGYPDNNQATAWIGHRP